LRGQFRQHKDDLLGLMAHQLRTPLTSIKGFAQLMLRRSTDTGALNARYAETVVREANRLSVMVDNVLDMERLETAIIEIEQQPFDLCGFLHGLADDPALVRAAGDHTIQWRLPAQTLLVCGDPQRLKEALCALVQRAATRAVTAEPIELSLTVTPATNGERDARRVEVTVAGDEPAGPAPSLDALLAQLDLRSIIDAQSAQYSDLALYTAWLLLRAQGGDLVVRADDVGHVRYIGCFYPLGIV
jgi:signal transduction histidine kinase